MRSEEGSEGIDTLKETRADTCFSNLIYDFQRLNRRRVFKIRRDVYGWDVEALLWLCFSLGRHFV